MRRIKMYKCKECKSTNVELKAWIKPNEGLIAGVPELMDDEIGYCLECDEQYEIIYEDN
jgi:hypothetical protein